MSVAGYLKSVYDILGSIEFWNFPTCIQGGSNWLYKGWKCPSAIL